ncbi:polysaccharide deacetylase family protein [Candidatus Formimonas warabiya]|uniref:Polysaccharide deacetylase n=1 Tax=Formimonas warabiya TaxID=1761012 RepID=A0A3G1KRJ7_FORW1|nr:polysaccharide deacetylase family protein [Candidatus Formimonas warabiya]ATW25103.1 polysaccharide deacetylase [Candidatus Formimonas warabiya]
MKKGLLALSSVALLFVITLALWSVSKSRTFQLFGEIYPRVDTSEKVVALTFDDGPTDKTDEILSILNDLNIKATFFVIGSDLEKNMSQGKRIVAAGHELGNHTYSHNRMVLKSYNYVRGEIEKTDQLIKEAGYDREIVFRPPNGKKLFVLPYYLKQHNRKTIMWDIEPDSYPDVADSSEKITKHVLENTKPGSIILLHVMYDSRRESMKSIRGIVLGLRRQGYSFKTVSELLKY